MRLSAVSFAALLPPPRVSPRVHEGEDADETRLREEEHGVGEAARECAPRLAADKRVALGHAHDLGEGDVDGAQELPPRPGARSSYQRAALAVSASAASRTTSRTDQPASSRRCSMRAPTSCQLAPACGSRSESARRRSSSAVSLTCHPSVPHAGGAFCWKRL